MQMVVPWPAQDLGFLPTGHKQRLPHSFLQLLTYPRRMGDKEICQSTDQKAQEASRLMLALEVQSGVRNEHRLWNGQFWVQTMTFLFNCVTWANHHIIISLSFLTC